MNCIVKEDLKTPSNMYNRVQVLMPNVLLVEHNFKILWVNILYIVDRPSFEWYFLAIYLYSIEN